ncbi:hypothetical protein ACFFRR_000593 [Megaselia abdita]
MLIEISLFIVAIFAFLLFHINENSNYFKKYNIKYVKYNPLTSLKELLLKKRSTFDFIEFMYNSLDYSIVGIFELWTPVFLVRSPDLINQIMVSDFNHFMNHRDYFTDEHNGILSNNLFALKDEKWKDMRATLTPAYTGSKLRAMFELIRETAEDFVLNLKVEIEKGRNDVELKDYFTRYANDIIATIAFGFKINSFKEKENTFLEMSKGIADFGPFLFIKFHFILKFKKLSKLLNISLISAKYANFYRSLILGTMKKRLDENIFRADMINILLEARENHDIKTSRKWTDDEVVSQVLMFFFSGFETVSSILCLISHELMENQEAQDKLKNEIQDVLEELNGNQLTYEILNGMKYMDCVVSEALRKWPITPITDRVCTKTVEIQDPETGEKLELNVGDKVTIPILGIHRDPKYFPDPMKFDPERFSDENKHNIYPNSYIPFGSGPRMCIAHRFAFLEIKTMLFYMFSDFRVDVSENSSIPLELDPRSEHPYPKNGFWVKILDKKK